MIVRSFQAVVGGGREGHLTARPSAIGRRQLLLAQRFPAQPSQSHNSPTLSFRLFGLVETWRALAENGSRGTRANDSSTADHHT